MRMSRRIPEPTGIWGAVSEAFVPFFGSRRRGMTDEAAERSRWAGVVLLEGSRNRASWELRSALSPSLLDAPEKNAEEKGGEKNAKADPTGENKDWWILVALVGPPVVLA
ncbi:unnamed protein product [Caenorhabditis auriculariae]|uniref:Uncharacterized protein n=1 Tax=Caenorhabditis auriculariae TaxID=2777116 RepID=A0A8S1HID2_9PELO|nr:unnamed protein product [Caenorhabditis auriculariae]